MISTTRSPQTGHFCGFRIISIILGRLSIISSVFPIWGFYFFPIAGRTDNNKIAKQLSISSLPYKTDKEPSATRLPHSSHPLPTLFASISQAQIATLSMPTPCLELANTLPTLCLYYVDQNFSLNNLYRKGLLLEVRCKRLEVRGDKRLTNSVASTISTSNPSSPAKFLALAVREENGRSPSAISILSSDIKKIDSTRAIV